MLKRPFAFFGGVTSLSFLSYTAPILWNGLALLCGILLFLIKRQAVKRLLLLTLAVFVSAGAFLALRNAVGDIKSSAVDGKLAYIEGYICELPEEYGESVRYTVKTQAVSVDGKKKEFCAKGTLWSYEKSGLSEYDRIAFYADVTALRVSERTNAVSCEFSLRGDVEYKGRQSKDLYYHCLSLRRGIIAKTLCDGEDEESALLSALIVGEKGGLSAESQTALRRSGITHLTVVSGVHLVTVTLFCYEVLKKLLRRSPTLIAIALVWIMAALTAFSPSAVRAAIMMTVLLGGTLFENASDPLNSLGIAVTLMILVTPGVIRDIGFLLSVFATLGLVLFANKWSDTFKRWMKVTYRTPQPLRSVLYTFAELSAQSLAAWTAVFPVSVLFFKSVSVVAPIVNILVGSIASTTLVFTFLAVSVPVAGILFLRLAKVGAAWIMWVAKKMASLPFSYIEITAEFAAVILLGVLLGYLYVRRYGGSKLAAASIALSVVFAGFVGESLYKRTVCRVDSLNIYGATVARVSCAGANLIYVASLPPEDVQRTVNAALYSGVTEADAVFVGDAYSLPAAKQIAERLGADRLITPIGVSDNVAVQGERLEADLGGARIIAVSKGSRLDVCILHGSCSIALTDGGVLNGEYDAVISSKAPEGSAILVTDAPSEYERITAERVWYTSREGGVTVCSNGKSVYKL